MADSNITKRALASAMKELMKEIPFEKINVGHICEKCNMNRKSFYYHFKDKYDLVNWIYDTEFISMVNRQNYLTGWDFLEALLEYLYANRDFYRKALRIKGQNSFGEHFHEMLIPIITEYLCQLLNGQEVQEIQVNFFVDGFACSIERWIQEKNGLTPKEFVNALKPCIQLVSKRIYKEMNVEE